MIIALLAATFLMGSSFVAGKILLLQGFPALVLVGWRFMVAAAATLPLVLLDAGPFIAALLPARARSREWLLVVVVGLFQTAGVMGLLFCALQSISAPAAAILLFTNPIWVAVLGRVFLREPLNGGTVAGMFVGVLGVGLALGVAPNALAGGNSLTGEMEGVGSALCWASATIIIKRARLPFGSWALSFWQMLIGAVALLFIAYSWGQHWPDTTTPAQWGWFVWLAIPASTGSFGLWFVALSKGGANRASGYLFLAPLFAVILSFAVLGSSLTWLQGSGGILIGSALWLLNRAGSGPPGFTFRRAAPLPSPGDRNTPPARRP